MNKNEKLLIIDGSSMLTTAFYGNAPLELARAKEEVDREPYYKYLLQTSDGIYTNAIYEMMKKLLQIIKQQQPEYIAICFDKTRDTFRREIYPEYKGTRHSKPEALSQQYALIEKLLQEIGISVFMSNRYEADDIAGSLVKKFKKDVNCIVMTKDFDYMQLLSEEDNVKCWFGVTPNKYAAFTADYPGCNFDTPECFVEVSEDMLAPEWGLYKASQVIDFKALAGDASDNIPGVKGIGDKTAIALLEVFDTVDEIYQAVDEKKENFESFVKEQKNNVRKGFYNKLTADGAKESAMMSKKLATIKTDIDLHCSLEDLKTHLKPNLLMNILKRYEFNSIIKDLGTVYASGIISEAENNKAA